MATRSPRRSAKRKSPRVRIPLTKGSLEQYGYADVMDMTTGQRRRALAEALRHEEMLPIFRKLNALYVMNKNKHPATAAVFDADKNWVYNNYM